MEVVIGDIVAKLSLQASEFQNGIRAALASLSQFQQTITQLTPAVERFGRAFQEATNQASQQMQALAQRTAQAHQSFTQFNQQINQTNQQFNQVNVTIQTFNTQLTQTNTTLNQARQAAQNFGSAWQTALGVAAGIGLATTLTSIVHSITNFISESVTLAAKMQDLHRSFVALEGSGQAANQTLAFLFQTAQRVGISFTEATDGFKRLEAGARGSVLTSEDLRRAFEGITAGARVLGVSSQQTQHALVAFEQVLTKGRLSSEEIVKQLGNAIPGGLAIMAQSLGLTTAQFRTMAESGIIPASVAVVAFSERMRQLGQGTGTIEGLSATFARLKNETVAWMTAIGEAIGSRLQPFLDKLTEISEVVRTLMGIPLPGQTAPGAGAATATGPYTAQTRFPLAESPYTALIQQEARRSAIDPGLLSQLVRAESNFKPTEVSPAGAIGLGQLMLPTAQGLEMGVTKETLLEPERNLRLAAKYLADMLEKFRGFNDQVKLALAAYNAGPGTVENLLNAARRAGTPTTFEAIQGQLPQETQQYVGRVLAPVTSGAGGAAAPPSLSLEGQARIAADWRKEVEKALEDFKELRQQVDNLANSGMNFGGLLNRDIAQQADKLVQKFADIAAFFARAPQVAAGLTTELRQQVADATQQATIWQATLRTTEQQRDLIHQQVEQMEQLIIRQRAQLTARTSGPEEAERFSRAALADLQQQRLRDRPTRAGMTLEQQIADDGRRLAALQNQANALGAQIEEERVRAQRPALEATLTRITSLMGRPDRSAPEQAAEQVRQQFEAARKQLIVSIQELARHPALQDLQEKFQNALQGLGTAADEQAQIMYERTDTQMRERITQIGDQIDQIRLRIGAAGLDPLATDLERIQREFAAMNAQLLRQQQILGDLAKTATPETQIAIAGQQDRIKAALSGVQPGLDAALVERRTRDERAYIEQAQRQLEQLQLVQGPETLFGPSRLALQLQQRTRTKTGESIFQTEEGARQARQLQDQIEAQRQLNYLAGVFEQFGNSVGQAWTQALFAIEDGTKGVADAFRDMARSILQSLTQIASQEAFKALISLGVRAIAGAATGGLGGSMGPYNPYASATSVAYQLPGVAAQGGAIINRPTTVLAGENPSLNPEIILNRPQMQSLLANTQRQAAASTEVGISIIQVNSRREAEQKAAQERSLGREVIISEVLSEMAQGEGSKIVRTIRSLQR